MTPGTDAPAPRTSIPPTSSCGPSRRAWGSRARPTTACPSSWTRWDGSTCGPARKSRPPRRGRYSPPTRAPCTWYSVIGWDGCRWWVRWPWWAPPGGGRRRRVGEAVPRLGVDIGGTFTDLVALEPGGGVCVVKVPSTPDDAAVGLWRAVDQLAERGGAGTIDALIHGTTVATNALLERRGARPALLITAGFEDLLRLRRQDRPALYDLARDHPPPLVERESVIGVAERIGAGGGGGGWGGGGGGKGGGGGGADAGPGGDRAGGAGGDDAATGRRGDLPALQLRRSHTRTPAGRGAPRSASPPAGGGGAR